MDRAFRYPDLPEGLEAIEDTMSAGKTIDEAIEGLDAERQRFAFFERYDLIDAGKCWLNRDLKRCFVGEGRVVVIDSCWDLRAGRSRVFSGKTGICCVTASISLSNW